MDEINQQSCMTCGGDARGYKCEVCGEVNSSFDPNHSCGGGHHKPMCAGCGEAESKCICPSS